MTPNKILIFAAGFGTRMGSLTKNKPKPLVKVAGSALIDHTLNLVKATKIKATVVNLHYFADQMIEHLAPYSDVQTIVESEILETGGGLKNALPLLGSAPVFTINSDAIFTGNNPLHVLANAWDPSTMDGLMLLSPTQDALGYSGSGDFHLGPEKQLTRVTKGQQAPYIYTGAQIIKTDLLSEISEASFSLNILWNRILKNKRLYGTIHNGGWVDVGHPQGIITAEALLKNANV